VKEEKVPKTVLVVADSPFMAEHMAEHMDELMEGVIETVPDCQMIFCANGAEVIRHIDGADVLITVFLPEMKGIKLTGVAKSKKPAIPILMMIDTLDGVEGSPLADKVIGAPFCVEAVRGWLQGLAK